MIRNTDKVLVEYRSLVTELTFFNKDEIVYQTVINGFTPVTRQVHELACEAAAGRNNLYLWPSYPTGSGVFIGRDD